MATAHTLFLAAIKPTRIRTPDPSKTQRMSIDGKTVTKYPDGSQYIWHNGSRRKVTPFISGKHKPIGMESMDI